MRFSQSVNGCYWTLVCILPSASVLLLVLPMFCGCILQCSLQRPPAVTCTGDLTSEFCWLLSYSVDEQVWQFFLPSFCFCQFFYNIMTLHFHFITEGFSMAWIMIVIYGTTPVKCQMSRSRYEWWNREYPEMLPGVREWWCRGHVQCEVVYSVAPFAQFL